MTQSLTLKGLQHKLRMLKPRPAEKNTPATRGYQSTRVTALEDGLNLNRHDGGLVKYADISLLLVFQLDSDPDTWYADVFVYGQTAPFRISQKVVNYRQFLPEISQRSKDNFFTFILFLIDQTDSVYIDDHTLEFLKSRKMASYPDFSLFEEYTRQLWFQLSTWMKFRCEQCGEVYWVDEAKISPQGAKTKCVKCQHIITVQKRAKPQPFTPTQKRPTQPCPHCQYENPEGTQFCVMCQKPLVDFAAKEKKSTEKPSPSSKTPEEGTPTEKPSSSPALDFSSLPLQAREQRTSNLSLRELAVALQDDINTLNNPFSWFSQFSRIMQWLGFVFLAGGVLVGVYIYVVVEIITPTQRMTYAGLSVGIGFLLSLACIIVSNIIALTLEIERNTKITTLLLHRLLSKDK